MSKSKFIIRLISLAIFFFVLGFLFGSKVCYGQTLKGHPIYNQIITNKPSIDKKYAMKLSNVIYRKAKYYDIDPHLFTAILAQESMYKLEAKNCTTGLIKGYSALFSTTVYSKARVCTDFGISQIYYKTAKSYKFNIGKLTTDLNYSVDAGMQVLKFFQRNKERDKYWWTRYNSSGKVNRERYRKLVERFMVRRWVMNNSTEEVQTKESE